MQQDTPHQFKSTYHEVALVFIVSMAQVLCQGGIAMSLSTMDIITESFEQMSGQEVLAGQKVWFMGSFALTVGTFILISGKLGDLFGLKLVFCIGWIWTTVWSVICGLSYYSGSIVFYITCRAFQGIGFSLLMPCGMGLIGNVYPNGPRKNIAFACVGAAGPSGAFIGALMAAVIAQLWWWPWCFHILAITCGLMTVFSIWIIPSDLHELLPPKEAIKRFDFLGSIAGVTGLILLNFAVNQGPINGWNTVYIVVLLVLAVLLVAAFFVIELHVKYPLLPRAVFNYRIGLVLLCIGLGWGSFGIWQYYYWVITLELRNYTPIMGGLTYIPFFILGCVASFLAAILISRIKPSFIIFFSCLAFCVGCIMLSVMPVDQSYFRIAFGQMLILTWGMDLSFAASSIILSDYLPKKHQGIAGSLVSTVVNYSVSFFLGLSSTVEVEVSHKTNDALKAYRCALYFGIGIAGMATVVALLFIFTQFYTHDAKGTFEAEDDSDSVESVEEKVENDKEKNELDA